MKSRLEDFAEAVVGLLLWGGSYVWGTIIGAMLVLSPLIMGNLIGELLAGMSATVALGVGVAAAYALGFPPWDAESRLSLLVAVGGATVSVILWELMRGSTDAGTLLVAIGLAVVGWFVRRSVDRVRAEPRPGQ